MNFPGEFYYSNNYIDCISFTPQKSYYRILNPSFWTQCYFHWMAYSTSGHIFQCLYTCFRQNHVHFSVVSEISRFYCWWQVVCFPEKFPVCQISCQLALSTFFFFVDILFCFTILKFYFILRYIHNYTIARRLKIECDSMYIEKWISLLW